MSPEKAREKLIIIGNDKKFRNKLIWIFLMNKNYFWTCYAVAEPIVYKGVNIIIVYMIN
jgi:hypothetical protein